MQAVQVRVVVRFQLLLLLQIKSREKSETVVELFYESRRHHRLGVMMALDFREMVDSIKSLEDRL